MGAINFSQKSAPSLSTSRRKNRHIVIDSTNITGAPGLSSYTLEQMSGTVSVSITNVQMPAHTHQASTPRVGIGGALSHPKCLSLSSLEFLYRTSGSIPTKRLTRLTNRKEGTQNE